MKEKLKFVLGTMMAFTSVFGQAHALTLSSATRDHDGRLFIKEEQRTTAPFAHVLFCHRTPQECVADAAPATVQLDGQKIHQLRMVNRTVNRQIRPRNDAGLDEWALAPTSGDCEDYAITKRHELVKLGWPASALRLAVAYTTWGEGHLLLVVKTTNGDLVLDNLTPAVRHWQQTGLRWQMIQSSADPRKWYRV